jgi:hypothetical protein
MIDRIKATIVGYDSYGTVELPVDNGHVLIGGLRLPVKELGYYLRLFWGLKLLQVRESDND